MERKAIKERQFAPFVAYKYDTLAKSNLFIGTKYKASPLENKVTYLAMLKIQDKDFEEQPDGIYVTLTPAEIKTAVGTNSGSFYESLKKVANEMTGNNMGIVDDVNERFEFITLINKASYAKDASGNPVFSVRFAKEMKPNLINIKRNFTNLPKDIVMKLKKAYSFPLYQMLKSQCYYPSSYTGPRDNVFSISFGLSELKLEMGVVNINAYPDVKRALLEGKGTTADYDKAVSKAPDKMFEKWNDFERKCLKPTVEEINEISDLYITYKKKSSGRGGKVYGVEFTVWLDGAEKNFLDLEETEIITTKKELNAQEMFALTIETADILKDLNLNYSSIASILEEADYDVERIKEAYELFKASPSEKTNAVGWLRMAIRDEYKTTTFSPSKGKKSATESYNQFPQNTYDFKALEEEFLSN